MSFLLAVLLLAAPPRDVDAHADRFAGLYANAGGPRPIHFGWLDNLGRVPLLEVLGARDDPLLVANVRTAVERLRRAGASIVFHEDPDAGHLVGFGHDDEFAGWIAERRRDPWPKRVAHGFLRLDQGRPSGSRRRVSGEGARSHAGPARWPR